MLLEADKNEKTHLWLRARIDKYVKKDSDRELFADLLTKKKLSERPPGQATFTSTSTPRLCKRRMRCWVTRCLSRSARYRPPRSW